MGRKHCGKRRNCSLLAIPPFPTVFSKGFFPGASKGVIVWEWINCHWLELLRTAPWPIHTIIINALLGRYLDFNLSSENNLTMDQSKILLCGEEKTLLSHNNPCFQCYIPIKNVLVLHVLYVYLLMSSYTKIPKHDWPTWSNEYVLDPYFFNSVHWIQLCDKKNLTFFDCWDEILLNLSWKMLFSLPLACLIRFFKTCLIKFYLNS